MSTYDNLLARVKLVRRQWRMQAVVKGISLFLALMIALLVLGVWGADLFGFRPAAVWLMRIVIGAAVIFVGWRFLYAPLHRPISDVQIAQFIEERYPQLEDRLITAVEFGCKKNTPTGMVDLLIRDALDKSKKLDFSVFVNRRRLTYFGLLGTASFLILFALLNWGPSFFPYGFNLVYVPWTRADFSAPMSIQVSPGNAEVSKGTDQQIKAQLIGFDSPDVQLRTTTEGAAGWSAATMEPEQTGSGFLYLLIDVRAPLQYYVEAKGIRSPTYTVKVLEVPSVEKISLTYNFPAYTGMAPQTVEGEGNISALKGTKVDLRIHLSEPLKSAQLYLSDKSIRQLTAAGSQDFAGTLAVERSGSYVVQLTAEGGRKYTGSTEYSIEAIDDAPPKVTILKPQRDLKATSVEEIFSEMRVEDDIGVSKAELLYSVNGGEEKVLNLFKSNQRQPEVTASHTFFLEEFALQPGDIISYYGKASDNNSVTGPGVSSSDIYFIQIRPFEQKYFQNQQAGSNSQGSSGEDGAQESLSKQQKEIVAAIFKLIRDKDEMDPDEYVESLKSLALVQSKLQAQTQQVVQRMDRRGASNIDKQFESLTGYLKGAIGEMEKAAVHLGAQQPSPALPEGQKALQQLTRAESLYREIQVRFQNAAGGGSGSQSQADAEDLADLFELEMNKLKNQYETVQRGEQQARDEKVDEARQRLKELAQRQQQLNERNGLQGNRGAASASSGGGQNQQQQLMEEAEKLQRQLQRLSRERSSPQLNQASNQLQKAIDEMKKSLRGAQQGGSGEMTAQGVRALQQLDEAMRQLSRSQEGRLSDGVNQASAEAKRLLEEQRKIQQGVDRLAHEKSQQGEEGMQESPGNLMDRKTEMAESLRGLQGRIEDLAKNARREQKETSNRLSEAAGTIRDKKLPDRIESNNTLLRNGNYETAKGREDYITSGLEDLKRQMEAASGSLGTTDQSKLEDAANKARRLAEGLEATQRRLSQIQRQLQRGGNAPGEQEESGQSQQGQGGQQGQQGRQSQQGQRGQRGSEQARGEQGASSAEGREGGRPGDSSLAGGGNLSIPPAAAGSFGNQEMRQLGSEMRQRLADAEDLARLLERNSNSMQNLERVIDNLRQAISTRNYEDPELTARLKASIDMLQRVESNLDRELSRLTEKDKYYYAEDGEAPSNYKKLVEEYYKAIARGENK